MKSMVRFGEVERSRSWKAIALVAVLLVSVILGASASSATTAKTPGVIEAWGNNSDLQLVVPPPNTLYVALAAGSGHSLGLKAWGSIVAWSRNTSGQCQVPEPNNSFIAVAAGYDHSLGLKSNGSIVAWGNNANGQLNVPAPNSGFVAVAAGGYHSLGLKSDGSVVAWGLNNAGQLNVPAPNTGFAALAGGESHSLGLKSDGSIVAWGNNTNGQLNVPAPNTGFAAVAAGRYHSLGLKTGGSVVAWGYNNFGQLNVPSPNSGFTAISAGGYHSLGLKADGWIEEWGQDVAGKHEVTPTGSNFVAISAGVNHNLAIFAPNLATWYLAEGTNAWGFATYITIENPNDRALRAKLTYMNTDPAATGKGVVGTRIIDLAPLSQIAVSSYDDIGEVDFSTKVECLEGESIAVDRTMCWTGSGASIPEAHSSVGVTSPAKVWYLPEGSSSHGFETWTLIQNPNDIAANVTLTYMTEDGGAIPVSKKVPACSRASFNMAADIGAHDSSIEVTSDLPVIAEHSQYRDNRREGSCSEGASSASTDFYMSEGTTAWGFSTYILVQNPNPEEAQVDVTYMTPAGPVAKAPFVMPANSRETIKVNDLPPVSNIDFSTKVHANKPIIAERAMYWTCPTDSAQVCHDSVGLSEPHSAFMMPDGQTTQDWETWTLVANPNLASVTIRVTYLPQNGGNIVTFTDEIPANSRRTYNMAGGGAAYPGFQGRASILVESLDVSRPIVAERSMYRHELGCGTNTIGAFEN